MAIRISGTTGIDMGNTSVSNASQVEVQEEQVSPFSGFKNYIINGNFDIWQRGTNQTSSGYASADRWDFHNTGTSSRTVTQTITTNLDIPYFNASKVLGITLTSLDSTTSGRGIRHIQPIEDVTKLAGKTVTYSFWARSTNNMDIEVTNQQVFGTGGVPSSTIVANARRFSLTPQWTKFTATVSMPSIIGKTLGTDGVHTSCTNFKFHLMADSVTAASEGLTVTLTPTAGTLVFFAQVQLEEGSIATPFEHRPYGLELSLCQRYYEVINGERILCSNGNVGSWLGATVTSYWKSTKRVPPTVTLTSWSGTMTALPSVGAAGLSAVFTTPSVQAGTAQYGQFSLIGSAEL